MNRKTKLSWLLVLVGLSLWLTSCLSSSDNAPDQFKQLHDDTVAIDNYLNSAFLQSEHDPDGLRMVIDKLGTGLPADNFDSVDVDYIGRFFPDGSVFDQKTDFKSPLHSLIYGWQIAFTTLPTGSEARLFVPSSLGYGPTANGSIPANSILVFDVKFHKVLKSATQNQKFTADTTAIESYLDSKGITGVSKDTTGLRYKFTQPGGGAPPTWYSRLKIHFTYKLLTNDSNVIFEANNVPSSFFYSRVVDYINGMKLGLMKMSKGSKATFYIPSGLAYGSHDAKNNNGTTVVPANSNLIVEVELLDFVP